PDHAHHPHFVPTRIEQEYTCRIVADKQLPLKNITPATGKQTVFHMVLLDAVEALEALLAGHHLHIIVGESLFFVAHCSFSPDLASIVTSFLSPIRYSFFPCGSGGAARLPKALCVPCPPHSFRPRASGRHNLHLVVESTAPALELLGLLAQPCLQGRLRRVHLTFFCIFPHF